MTKKKKKLSYFQVLNLIHLYLSSFFTPLVIIFVISGVDLTIDLDDYFIFGDIAEKVLYNFRKIHRSSRLSTRITDYFSKDPFILFTIIFSIGAIASLLTGTLMALKMKRYRKTALVLLALGIIVPLLILFMQ